jgi:hypothetical protein
MLHNMKKLLSILTLFTGLTFVNTVFAWDDKEGRCKVEYTMLDLITGVETDYKDTGQWRVENHCNMGAKNLDKKIAKRVQENTTSMITRLNAFECKIRGERVWYEIKLQWAGYYVCAEYHQKNIMRFIAASTGGRAGMRISPSRSLPGPDPDE